jgi:hypothetical protein
MDDTLFQKVIICEFDPAATTKSLLRRMYWNATSQQILTEPIGLNAGSLAVRT